MVALLTDYQQRIQDAQQRAPVIAFNLAMGTHPRLGNESPVAMLTQKLLRSIIEFSKDAEIHMARQPRVDLFPL